LFEKVSINCANKLECDLEILYSRHASSFFETHIWGCGQAPFETTSLGQWQEKYKVRVHDLKWRQWCWQMMMHNKCKPVAFYIGKQKYPIREYFTCPVGNLFIEVVMGIPQVRSVIDIFFLFYCRIISHQM